jgi:methyl-accepting chemotaxis protein
MNLQGAILAHAEWKVTFRGAIANKEKLNASNICVDNACPLGQWLQGEGKVAHDKLDSYGKCVKKHAAFHNEAGKIAAAINAGKYTEAEAMMAGGTPYAIASTELGTAIVELRIDANL